MHVSLKAHALPETLRSYRSFVKPPPPHPGESGLGNTLFIGLCPYWKELFKRAAAFEVQADYLWRWRKHMSSALRSQRERITRVKVMLFSSSVFQNATEDELKGLHGILVQQLWYKAVILQKTTTLNLIMWLNDVLNTTPIWNVWNKNNIYIGQHTDCSHTIFCCTTWQPCYSVHQRKGTSLFEWWAFLNTVKMLTEQSHGCVVYDVRIFKPCVFTGHLSRHRHLSLHCCSNLVYVQFETTEQAVPIISLQITTTDTHYRLYSYTTTL